MSFAARLAIGIVLMAHGLQKLLGAGVQGTAQGFGKIGIPLPTVAAWYATLVELVGGALFILGLALPVVGVLIALNMAGALYFVHLEHGLFAPQGYEYVLVLGLASLALGFHGGRWAIDHALFGRRRQRASAEAGSSAQQ